MKTAAHQLGHLLAQDLRLLWRNQVISISIAVSLIYVFVFRMLAQWIEQPEALLVLVIFNDPALLGFLFIGVMLLFERNENTLQALAVSPLSLHAYIWSKSIAMTFIALLCCLGMAWACYGAGFGYGIFIISICLTGLCFTFIGLAVAAGKRQFNRYFPPAIGLLILLSLPFFGYFGLCSSYWFVWLPTWAALESLSGAFGRGASGAAGWQAGMALLGLWTAAGYFAAYQLLNRHFH